MHVSMHGPFMEGTSPFMIVELMKISKPDNRCSMVIIIVLLPLECILHCIIVPMVETFLQLLD